MAASDVETRVCNMVLLVSLVYLTFNLASEWSGFEGCGKPVHVWLLVSYVLLISYRLVHIGGALGSSGGNGVFLLNLRQQSTFLRTLTALVWWFIVPVYTMWSALGTSWVREVLRETPQCVPNEMQVWCLVLFQFLSYAWILVHVSLGATAWWLERRVRKAEADLEQIVDVDTLERWGMVNQIEGYTSLPQVKVGDHLSPDALLALPGVEIWSGGAADEDCPICLTALQAGDTVRQLRACSHVFHRSCIDLWLLRSADCPLCKSTVSRS